MTVEGLAHLHMRLERLLQMKRTNIRDNEIIGGQKNWKRVLVPWRYESGELGS